GSAQLSFSVIGEEPPFFSSPELEAGAFQTGVNNFALTLVNPATGKDYQDTGVQLTLSAVAGDEVLLEKEEADGSWSALSLAAIEQDLATELIPTGPLTRGSSTALKLRLTLAAPLRGRTIEIKAVAFERSVESSRAITGAEKSFSLTVQGPAVTLGPTLPAGSPPTFGESQGATVDFTLDNPTAAEYQNLSFCLTLSGVPTSVPLSGPGALEIVQVEGSSLLPVQLERDASGNIKATVIPAEGLTLGAGAKKVLTLKITWPTASAGTYTWSTALTQRITAGSDWAVAVDSQGSFAVAAANPTVQLSTDRPGFGAVPLNAWSTPVNLTVTNTGNVVAKLLISCSNTADGKYKAAQDFYVRARMPDGKDLYLSGAWQSLPVASFLPGESFKIELSLKPLRPEMVSGTYQITITVDAQKA
ncbi:MAG: hypothetical protein ACPLRU_05460, partial [Desulfofundulus sp.]